MINIGQLTSQVIMAFVEASGQLVGDGVAPEGGGWISGQPNVSAFVPYGVVSSMGGSVGDQTWRYEQQIRSWETQWRLSSFGGSRAQCDWVAALLRDGLDDCIGQEFGGYKVMGAFWRSLGPMTRQDVTDPPMWSVTDMFSLRCDA